MINPEILESLIDELGLNYKTNSISFIFHCPKSDCGKDVMYMYRASGVFLCMRCHFKGSAAVGISALSGISVYEISNKLYGTQFVDTTENLQLNLDSFFGETDEIDFEIIPKIKWSFEELPINHKHSIKGLKYLESRGIPLNIALKYNIRYSPTKQRVLFPLEVDGRLLGHQDRIIVPNRVWSEEDQKFKEAPKAISTDNLPTSRVVMFGDNLNGSEHAIIAEGPVDCIKFDEAKGNIATLGKGVSLGQISYIRSKGVKRIYLALDNDAYADSAKLAQEFSDLEVYKIDVLPGMHDFGDMSFEQCLQAFKDAKPVLPGHLFVHFN